MSDTGWFGRRGIAQLAQSQQKSVGGISSVTRTCIAAYKQFDDVEYLLGLLPATLKDEAQDFQVTKIKERHKKYRIMAQDEVIPERA